MITYNWKRIWQKSQGSASKILDIISYITYDQIPENIHDPIMKFVDTDWSGTSFILNPKPLLENRIQMYEKDLAEYVALASFRSLAEYKVTKRTTLLLEESPIDPEDFNNNRFLTVDNKAIHFLWEEATH